MLAKPPRISAEKSRDFGVGDFLHAQSELRLMDK
jgi:hypothetical protein